MIKVDAFDAFTDSILNYSIGDGTVPGESSVGQFENDGRVQKYRVINGRNTHTGLMSNEAVQQQILDIISAPWLDGDISTQLAGLSITSGKNAVWNDPVDMLVVDGKGRRFGYITQLGPVTEIPNSIWYGGRDGIGWIFGDITPPLKVELTGLDGSYAVKFSGTQRSMFGGYEGSGYLNTGETLNTPVTIKYTPSIVPMLMQLLF